MAHGAAAPYFWVQRTYCNDSSTRIPSAPKPREQVLRRDRSAASYAAGNEVGEAADILLRGYPWDLLMCSVNVGTKRWEPSAILVSAAQGRVHNSVPVAEKTIPQVVR